MQPVNTFRSILRYWLAILVILCALLLLGITIIPMLNPNQCETLAAGYVAACIAAHVIMGVGAFFPGIILLIVGVLQFKAAYGKFSIETNGFISGLSLFGVAYTLIFLYAFRGLLS